MSEWSGGEIAAYVVLAVCVLSFAAMLIGAILGGTMDDDDLE